MHLLHWGRIWPLCYSFGVLPDEIVFPEDEERAVDGEAVLFDGVRVVNGHCPCSLCHRLLVHPLATRSGSATPGSPSPGARSASPSAACAASIAGGQIFSESSHSGNARIRQGKSKVMSVGKEGRRITTNTFHPNQSVRRSAIKELKKKKVASSETALLCSSPFIHPLRHKFFLKKRINQSKNALQQQGSLHWGCWGCHFIRFADVKGGDKGLAVNEMTADQPVSVQNPDSIAPASKHQLKGSVSRQMSREDQKSKITAESSCFFPFPCDHKKGKIIQHGQLSRDFSLIARRMKGPKEIKQVLKGSKEKRMWPEQAYRGGVRTQRQPAGCGGKHAPSEEVNQSPHGSKHQRLSYIYFICLHQIQHTGDRPSFKKERKIQYFIIVINYFHLSLKFFVWEYNPEL